VATIVLEFSATMTTNLYWSPNLPENTWLSLCKIQQAIVRRIQPPRNWQRKFDVYGDPMSKGQPGFGQIIPQNDVPFRKIIKKKSPTRFQYSNAVIQPFLAPRNVILIGTIIVYLRSVFFGKIKWGISKYCINGLPAEIWEKLQAVPFIKDAQLRRVYPTLLNFRFSNVGWYPYFSIIEDLQGHNIKLIDKGSLFVEKSIGN